MEEIKKDPLLSGVTFSGGEPFEQPKPLLELAKQIRGMGLNLVIYTGYLVENLLKQGERKPEILELMSLADIIVDGPFLLEERDLNLKFRGSRNQRVIDGIKTVQQKKIIETEF